MFFNFFEDARKLARRLPRFCAQGANNARLFFVF